MSSNLHRLLQKMMVQNLTESEYAELALEFSRVHSKEAGELDEEDEKYINETIADELGRESGNPIAWVIEEKKKDN